MPTSTFNFNFLALLVSEILRGGGKIKIGAADLPRRPKRTKFLHKALVLVNAYTIVPNFKFLAGLV